MNWKTLTGSLGIIITISMLVGGWYVTNKTAEAANSKVEKLDEKVDNIEIYIAKQQVMNESQFAQQKILNEILTELKEK